MPTPDRDRGVLTTDDRDYLTGRKNLQSGSERNTRNRIRHRIRDAVYDFEYLTSDLEERDVAQLVAEDGEINDELFEAAEDVIGFVFRMCAQVPEESMKATDDLFREVVRNGLEKGVKERHELLDFKFEFQHGVPRERQTALLRKIHQGEDLTLPELREAVNHEYFDAYLDDSFRFRALDSDGLPKDIDIEDTLSKDDYTR